VGLAADLRGPPLDTLRVIARPSAAETYPVYWFWPRIYAETGGVGLPHPRLKKPSASFCVPPRQNHL